MNILFLSTGRLETLTEGGVYADLLNEFRDKGHKLFVVATREKRLNLPTERKLEDGIDCLRVRVGNITKTNYIEKGISLLLLEGRLFKYFYKHFGRIEFDLILYSTPPITLSKIIRRIQKKNRAKTYLLLKDIFPQNAIDLGILSHFNPLYWYFRLREKSLYQVSDHIGCMSQANVKYVLEHNPSIGKDTVEVCPNSITPVTIAMDGNAIKESRIKHNLPLDKIVFIYGGNLGRPQGIDFLIACLDSIIDNDKVHFVITGSGTEFNKLKGHLDKAKQSNVQLLHHLPRSDYELLVSSCDVGLIFLDSRFTIPNFPSRLLSYMQASLPVLAATDASTDIGKVIEEGEFGFWCESTDVKVFNTKMEQLCNEDLRRRMGFKAREYLENHYTAKHSYEIIMKHFR